MKPIYAVTLATALIVGGISTAMAQSYDNDAVRPSTRVHRSERIMPLTAPATTGSGVSGHEEFTGSGTPGNTPPTEPNATNPNGGAQRVDPDAAKDR
ncbi:MAG: hypothetical protein JO205_06230 [Pseudolabrys sp.]|nr:hypothetical protein [Pseudolabrys sp.]